MAFDFQEIQELINREASLMHFGSDPDDLYAPIRYIMQLGGKRVRPVLTLLGYYMFDDHWQTALKPALATEVFHNFTLMHDDIMDQAPLRRGMPTVHEKWNQSTAILSGDVMLVKAYELFAEIDDPYFRRIFNLFNVCVAGVCEGQQLDMNFEVMDNVSEEQYLEMIRLKTAVLLGFALEIGAVLAGASEQQARLMRDFGTNIGIGFQLKDDLLDVYGDQEKVGKQAGGDIIANKKTFLLIKALEESQSDFHALIRHWINKFPFDKQEKVNAIVDIYNKIGIREMTERKMNAYFQEGFRLLEMLEVPAEKKELLRMYAVDLINREK